MHETITDVWSGAAPGERDHDVTNDDKHQEMFAAAPDDFVDQATNIEAQAFAIGSQPMPPLSRTPRGTAPPALQQDPTNPYVVRERMWAFVVDDTGQPIELGSGRFAKAYLGQELWHHSKTGLRRPVALKCLQVGVTGEDRARFQMEKEILERVQGHPNIVELLGSGEGGTPGCSDAFIPPSLRSKLQNDFMVLELLDLSLEERLKGARHKRRRDDLLSVPMPERLFRVLDYVLPVACAVEFAHLVRNTSHRDIKPANILLKLPVPHLRGSTLQVKLADFNVAKAADQEVALTKYQPVPGTLYFQSPEQETSTIELLVNCSRGSQEVQFFEDFYTGIEQNDTFSLFNREERYTVLAADRAKKRLLLDRPFAEPDEVNVRGRIIKAVGRPADIYSLGGLLYYLISGAYANPKSLYDAFRRFYEYDKTDDNNTVASYLEHEYSSIQSRRTPKVEGGTQDVAYEDKFFSYKHYLDGNGELIDRPIMQVVAKAMIRNKPDSYCMSHDLETTGISSMVHDLLALSMMYGVDPNARLARSSTHYQPPKKVNPVRRALDKLLLR